MGFKKLSDSEMEIMDLIWTINKPIGTSELLDIFNKEKGKGWKVQTVHTFLKRLCEKELLKTEKKGKGYLYSCSLSKSEYEQKKAKNVLQKMYDGSIKQFLTALSGGEQLEQEEVDELKEWLSKK